MIKKKGLAKFISFVLTICMVMSMSPVIAFAGADASYSQEKTNAGEQKQIQAEQQEEQAELHQTEQAEEQAENRGGLTPVKYLAPVYNTAGDPKSGLKKMEKKTCTNYTVITKGMKEMTDKETGGWYVLSSEVELNHVRGITVSGDVHLIL